MWGSYGLLDVLNKHFQETLHVTKAQSGLLQAAYFGALSRGAARRILWTARAKAGILVGLCLYALGAAVRAGGVGQQLRRVPVRAVRYRQRFGLETAANPYATVLATRRAPNGGSTAQSFNGLGQFIGPLIGGTLFFSASQSAGGA